MERGEKIKRLTEKDFELLYEAYIELRKELKILSGENNEL